MQDGSCRWIERTASAVADEGVLYGIPRRLTDLVATVIENTESREALSQLAEEQAALRRVATLVAGGAPPQDVFAAVVEEIGRLLPVESAAMGRYEPDGFFVTVAAWSATDVAFPVGRRWAPEGKNVTGIVLRTGRPARLNDFSDASGPVGARAREAGYRSAVGSPIVVEGRLWGVMTAASTAEEPLPADTEARLASFTELVATAIANAESRPASRGSQKSRRRCGESQFSLHGIRLRMRSSPPSPKRSEPFSAPTSLRCTRSPATGRRRRSPRLERSRSDAADRNAIAPGRRQRRRPHLPHGAASRMDAYVDVEGEAAVVAHGLRLRTTVGAPILVDGRLWGALMAATRGAEPFPEDAETRIAAFTELVATAISNTEAREALARLADEQAALRRVATLVAQGMRPAEVFSAVSNELDRLFGSAAAVLKFEHDGAATVVVGSSDSIDIPPGTRSELEDGMASAQVYRTGRSSRVDPADGSSAPGPAAATARRLGTLSTVASPIVVEGGLWGAMTVWSANELLPLDAEARLEKFTELVATAIANAESKAELAASRRRIVAASDEARRRIERDLHDGTQQRLVSLGLAVRAAEADLLPGGDARSELFRVATGLNDAVTELQEISRGIHPAILSQGGLGPALRTLARRSAIPVELDVATDTRLPAAIEVAAYYVASEALANAAKHAQASRIELSLASRDGKLLLSIRDDGVGGADPAHGSGVVGLNDRVEALAGSMYVQSRPGEGTHIVAELPLEMEVVKES